jgi:hypothetical protein
LSHAQAVCEKEYKKDLKKLSPAASKYCSSYIASTITVILPTTIIQTSTQVTTVTAPTPTVTQLVYSDCGIVGFDNGAVPAYFFDSSGAFGTFATCSARCKQDAGKCQSFAFGNGQCLLYTANV